MNVAAVPSVTELPDCVFCSSKDNITRFGLTDMFGDVYEIRHCRNCLTHFLSPRPSADALSRAYSGAYYGNSTKKFKFGFTEQVIEGFRKSRAKRLARRLGPNPAVLDIGCGNGNFLKHLKDLTGAEAHGIERDSMSAARASREGLEIHTGMDQLKAFPDGRFDAVTLFHVFEHLDTPVSQISEIRRILKPGGILIMSFPDIGSWQARCFRSAWLHLDPPRHLFFVHRSMFRRYMAGAGFRTISEKGFSPEQNPYGAVQSLLNSVSGQRDVLFERLKGNARYAPGYGKWIMLLQKAFFISVFPFFIITDIVAGIFKKSATVTFTFIRESS